MRPQLLTLGQLRLSGLDFRREKPLLLLAYLSLCGPQPRRSVARQFWPGAADPLNSLSVAVAQLRRVNLGLIDASETQVRTALRTDAEALQVALRSEPPGGWQPLYRGPFLADLTLAELGEELEEWVMNTREALADACRNALLDAAKQRSQEDPAGAAVLAADAYRLPCTTPLLPGGLRELYGLLTAAGHAAAAQVQGEAQTLGLRLTVPEQDRGGPLLGRTRELERMHGLRAGETLWVWGAAGLGKSTLLRSAAPGATLLHGRSGHPFQTLAPLAEGGPLPASPNGWLALLGRHAAPVLLDDWEASDPESRRVLLALAHSRAGPPLTLGSRERSPLGTGSGVSELRLHPLAEDSLTPELYARTAGIPALIGAVRRGESLPEAVAALLSPLTPKARQLLACLCVQEKPELQCSGAALQLGPDDMAQALESLEWAGWWRSTAGKTAGTAGAAQVVPQATVQAWLAAQPTLEAEVLTLLAPQVPADHALPLYLRAHALTGSSDLPGFQTALYRATQRLLDAEQASEAEALLARHARTPETQLLHARALDVLGRSPEAMKCLKDLPLTPAVQVVRARTLFRLGQTEAAKLAAQAALKGDLAARAQAYNVLGALGLAAREYAPAKQTFERACGLFRLQADEAGYLNALCNQAVAMTELHEDTGAVMDEIQALAGPSAQALTLLNIGWLLERQERLEAALGFYLKASERAETLCQSSTAGRAWNNVGVIHQKLGHDPEAAQAYEMAIGHTRSTGETRVLAMVLGNLAELRKSLPLIEEAIELLHGIGQSDLAAYFETQRETFRGRSGVS